MDNPLFLPKGSVRAMIALAVVAGTITMCFVRTTVPEGLIGIAGIIIGFYFGSRTKKEMK